MSFSTIGPNCHCGTQVHLHRDVVVHSSRQSDWSGVVRKWPDHMEVARHWAHEVESQVTEGHEGVTKETETLPRHYKIALVILSLRVIVVFCGGGCLQDGVSSLNKGLQSLLHPAQLRQHLCQLGRAGVIGSRLGCWSLWLC